jgi:hypothetical protein
MESFDAIIIGGGPAGLFAAINYSQSVPEPSNVLLLERREKPGCKLLLSGSGQCNITHAGSIDEFLLHYGGGEKNGSAFRFLRPALYNFSNEDLLVWFGNRGVEFEFEEGGKIFPSSRKAIDILRILLDECSMKNIHIKPNRRVRKIERSNEKFVIRTEVDGHEEEYEALCTLISTGGITYPQTGSTGDGYSFSKILGHTVLEPRPSLAPICIDNFSLGSLAGLSFPGAGLKVRSTDKNLYARTGDLLITHKGFSGPLVLDSSRYIKAGDTLEIRFSEISLIEFKEKFERELNKNPRKLVRSIYASMGLPKRMADLFCDSAGISETETASQVSRVSRNQLSRLACSHECIVGTVGSIESAMATAGGVDIAEVNPKTMESRLIPRLFFAGEVLDIDGDTGGFNLQAAFSMGALAGQSMAYIHSVQE